MDERQARPGHETSLLMEACRCGDSFVAQKSLHLGADVNCASYGRTPLMTVVHKTIKGPRMYGRISGKNIPLQDEYAIILRLLIIDGADMNATDARGNSPLGIAVVSHNLFLVEELLESGANANVFHRGVPLLSHALDSKTRCLVYLNQGGLSSKRRNYNVDSIVGLLMKHGADVNMADSRGVTPLMKAFALAGEEKIFRVKHLLKDGGNVNRIFPSGKTLLTIAIKEFNTYPWLLTSLLQGFNPDVNQVGKSGETPINLAIDLKNVEIVELLADAGAYIFEHAVRIGDDSMVNMLIQTGAMPKIFKETMLMATRECVLDEVSPLFVAFWIGNKELINRLLSIHFLHEFDINTPLWFVEKLADKMSGSKCPDVVELFKSFYLQPKSLFTLSFVKVSMSLGFQPDRRDRVARTMLPLLLQCKLLFGVASNRKKLPLGWPRNWYMKLL